MLVEEGISREVLEGRFCVLLLHFLLPSDNYSSTDPTETVAIISQSHCWSPLKYSSSEGYISYVRIPV